MEGSRKLERSRGFIEINESKVSWTVNLAVDQSNQKDKSGQIDETFLEWLLNGNPLGG